MRVYTRPVRTRHKETIELDPLLDIHPRTGDGLAPAGGPSVAPVQLRRAVRLRRGHVSPASLRHRVASRLASPRLAFGLMIYLGVYAFLGSLVAQGTAESPKVVAWALAHPGVEQLVRSVGFHEAYTTPLFLVPAALLLACTAVCAWRRTRVALWRGRALARTGRGDVSGIGARPTFTLPLASADEGALETAEEVLNGCGVKVNKHGDVLVAGSPVASVAGSPLFHWSLVALICAIALGSLFRADGVMGIAVGDVKPLAAESFGVLTAGRFHSWPVPPPTIAVEGLDVSHRVGGIDRGAAPLVVVRDARGSVLAQGSVYPNHPLRFGSVIVHPGAYGLAANVALVDARGNELGRSRLLLDFDSHVPAGTDPGGLTLSDAQGNPGAQVTLAVPLDMQAGSFVQVVPTRPTAEVTVTSVAGNAVLAHAHLQPGESVPVDGGARLRLDNVGYYARLAIVDDPSVPMIYVSLVLALVGVTMALLLPQWMLVVRLSTEDDRRVLEVTTRDWRNASLRLEALEVALRAAFAGNESGGRR